MPNTAIQLISDGDYTQYCLEVFSVTRAIKATLPGLEIPPGVTLPCILPIDHEGKHECIWITIRGQHKVTWSTSET